MSWDPYVPKLKAKGCSDGFIMGRDGKPWTTCNRCSDSEMVNIARDMETIMQGKVPSSQLKLREVDYFFLRKLDNIACFKKKEFGGVAIYATKTALVVGLFDEGMQAGTCNEAVYAVGTYLDSLEL